MTGVYSGVFSAVVCYRLLNHLAWKLHALSTSQNGNSRPFPKDVMDGSSVRFVAGIERIPDSLYWIPALSFSPFATGLPKRLTDNIYLAATDSACCGGWKFPQRQTGVWQWKVNGGWVSKAISITRELVTVKNPHPSGLWNQSVFNKCSRWFWYLLTFWNQPSRIFNTASNTRGWFFFRSTLILKIKDCYIDESVLCGYLNFNNLNSGFLYS